MSRIFTDRGVTSLHDALLERTTVEDVHRARLVVVEHVGSGPEALEVLNMLGIGPDFPEHWIGPIAALDKPRYAR